MQSFLWRCNNVQRIIYFFIMENVAKGATESVRIMSVHVLHLSDDSYMSFLAQF